MADNNIADNHEEELEDDDEEGGFRIDDIYVPPPPPASCTFDPTGPRLMIQKIENINFKSYAGKKIIGPFHKNFTAIVGPNGSGKSNVIDSMLFVFGYRAQKIRSKKVGVLIHNSTSHNNLDSCTVNVYFQKIVDTDQNTFEVVPNSEFVVGRTAHRDNSSYYTVNGKRCTYKEATKTLRSFGIDLDHNRFLILQGEVEQIALMKPKAQTEHDQGMLEFLEDIVGSSRYKEPIELLNQRIDKLSEERTEKLNRVKLVEKDMEELKGARDEAVEFLKSENEIAVIENQLFQLYRRNEKIHEAEAEKQVKETQEQMAELKKELDAQQQAQKEQQAELKKALKDCEKKEKEVETRKQEFSDLERRDLQCREAIKHIKQKGKDLEKSLESAKQKVDELKKQPTKLEKDMEKLQAKKEKLEKEKVEAEAKLAEVMESLKTQTEELQEEKAVHEQELLGLQKGVSDKKSQYEIAKSELDLSISTHQRETSRLDEIELNLDKVNNSLTDKSNCLTRLEKLVPEKDSKLKEMEAELAQVRQQYQEAQDQLRADRHRVEELRSNAQANRSRSRVLDALLQAKKSGELPGVIGRLGDLGAIDQKYDVAISTACGQLDYVLTDTVLTAQRCVEYLKKHDVGFANLIALEKMERWIPYTQRRIETPENVPRLFDLVSVKDTSVLPAFYFVLRDTLVANDLDQATRIGLQGRTRHRVVTLQGELVDVSGTMSGGGGRVSRGKMGQAVVDDDVSAAQMEQLTAQLTAIENKAKDLHERQSVLDDKINVLRKDVTTSKHALHKFQVEVKGLKEQHASLTKQLADQKEKVAKSAPDKKKLAQQEKAVAAYKKEYDQAMASWTKVEDKVTQIHAKIMDITGKCMGSVQQKVESVTKQLDATLMEIARTQSSIKTVQRNLGKAESKATTIESELEEAKTELEKRRNEYSEVEKAGKELLDIRDIVQAELKTLKQKLAEVQAKIDSGKSAENALSSKQIEIKNQLEQSEAALQDRQAKVARWTRELRKLKCHSIEGEPEVTLPELEDKDLEELSSESLTMKSTLLKENLSAKKPNMAAIQEYRRKEEAYKQRVAELEAVTEKRAEQRRHHDNLRKQRLNEFMRGFGIISSKLKETYQMLTLGGDAELELVDSLDPFTEGIVFSVRPPKKSWKNISNLSGGEKTLSSLALVFALHYYKPTPFYVMDEIDAALDIRNVSIVGYYIKERTRNAQFIIISLRNNMFELSDRLIGIYKVHNCTNSCTVNPRRLIEAVEGAEGQAPPEREQLPHENGVNENGVDENGVDENDVDENDVDENGVGENSFDEEN
ncbi:structural maintenance of chromosomes 4-like protein gluon [Rhipicephalus microplus]|uniref:structural maintenance of chromosomes 4-like protein gluon n=1 Tax=Rhipicephalus microplus TaxID=6941 RepID=UPI003F6C7680